MRSKHLPVVAASLAALALPAAATVIIDWVTVGDINNPADPYTGSLYGSVDHVYNIGKNEVTVGQYCEFLNHAAAVPAGLYQENLWSSYMASDGDIAGISRSGSGTVGDPYSYATIGSPDRPITYVSWFDAARFTNWMHNGQGSGSTETGAYNLGGAEIGTFTVQPGATVWIPSEDEWYKAAYYDASKNGGAGGYWLQPTQSDTLVGNTIGVAHSANYWDGNYAQDQNGLPSRLTDVGAYGANSASYYGTNDQGGNVYEWNDAVISGSSRGFRGGGWNGDESHLGPHYRGTGTPTFEWFHIGFRPAAIPEPSASLLVLIGGGLGMIRRRRPTL